MARKPRLGKSQRKAKKLLELETGQKFTDREFLMSIGKLKDEYDNRDTSDFFGGSAYQ